MFFQKKTPPVVEYPAALDAEREICPIFIDVSVFPFKILSVERTKINTPEEMTTIYCIWEGGKVDDFSFEISRKAHRELINSLKK